MKCDPRKFPQQVVEELKRFVKDNDIHMPTGGMDWVIELLNRHQNIGTCFFNANDGVHFAIDVTFIDDPHGPQYHRYSSAYFVCSDVKNENFYTRNNFFLTTR